MRRSVLVFGLAAVTAVASPVPASAHLHPFNPAAACAPATTGAGNESTAFFTAPGVQEHWTIVDEAPGVPGIQFLVPNANPGAADESQGAIADAAAGNPGVAVATQHCH